MRRFLFGLGLATSLALAACGSGPHDADVSLGTLVPVRGAVTVGGTRAAPTVRIGGGEEGAMIVPAGALARLVLDTGQRLVLGGGAQLSIDDEAEGDTTLKLAGGRVFVDVPLGDALSLVTPKGTVRTNDAALSIAIGADGGATVYVVRGEAAYTAGTQRGVVRAGEELALSAAAPRVSAQTLWSDWTGGLARPGPEVGDAPAGMGQLEARVPDELGTARWPLVIRRLDVRVEVVDDLAITEVDQEFFNPASETVEGLYRIRVPEGAVLSRFAVDRGGRLVDGYVREKETARAAYQAQVYRGSTDDPALLEWDAPDAYRARIYPIAAGETRRIVTRYAQWLSRPAAGAPRMYRYPMGSTGPLARVPHVQELGITVDVSGAGKDVAVRAGLGATIDEGVVRLRQSDVRPRADFWMEILGTAPTGLTAYRAGHEAPERAPGSRAVPNEADERDYYYVPVVLPDSVLGDASATSDAQDLVIVADISAGTDASHLELGRSVVESLVSQLGESDRVAIVTSDVTLRGLGGAEAQLGAASAQRIGTLLDALARAPAGGATDLGGAIADAGAICNAGAGTGDTQRSCAVVYVGDGAPTVGELGAEGLLERMARLPRPVRLYAVAVGAEADLELLEALSRGGGLALRVEDRTAGAEAALRILGHASRPLAQRVVVQLGTGIDNVFPRRPMDVVIGEVLPVLGRVRNTLPTEVVVTGVVRGREFREVLKVQTRTTEASTDLRLRWAGERLRQLLLEGAGRESIAELGTRYGLITPFTSYYVPSARELREMGESARLYDYELLDVQPQETHETREALATALAVVAFPLTMTTGCGLSGRHEPEPTSTPEEAQESPSSDESHRDEGGKGKRSHGDEGQMGKADARRTTNRYGIEGPQGNPDPHMARDEARETERSEDGDRAEASPDSPAREAPAVGILGTAPSTGAWNSPTSPFGQDTALGADPMDALGALMGESTGENFGFGGLGLRGTGRGGGGTGDGTIGLGNLGTIGHGGGGGDGSGYGRGSGGFSGRNGRVPRVRLGNADVRGSLSKEVIRRVIQRHINEVRFCYEQQLNQRPDLQGRISVHFVIAPTGAVQTAAVSTSDLGSPATEQCVAGAVRRWTFPAPEGGGIVVVNFPFVLQATGGDRDDTDRRVAARPPAAPSAPRIASITTTVTFTTTEVDHRPSRCSEASGLSIADRRALWSERLSRGAGVSGWVEVYRAALRACEVPAWTDRRALLELMLAQAGSISTMVQVYRFLDDGSARSYLRAAILRRVRTPADLRVVRDAFGLSGGVDFALVEQVLARATTPALKIRALRQLVLQYPDSFDLKLRLLSELEAASKLPEAKRLAEQLRRDPLADAGVRTAIGEMYLRLSDEGEARRVFSEIVEFAPQDELARRRLGDLYRAHGWYEDAYRQYQTLATIRPDDPSVSLLLAQAAAGAGRVDEALRLEQKLAETAEPGASEGLARTALLWSSVRFAELRKAAREAHDDAKLAALAQRVRRSGVLREAGALRASLVWSHPDAGLSLWASHPGVSLVRPDDLSPEYGLEAFDVREQESGNYGIEVRRTGGDARTSVEGKLVVVWNEGTASEKIEIVALHFDASHRAYAWSVSGNVLTQAPLSATASAIGR